MKIVVLDGYTLNPGDLNWQDLERLGELKVYDRTDPTQIIERALDAEIILTNKTVLSSDSFKQLKKLKYIGVLATGYNVVDTETAREKNILITNVPSYGTESVAQMVFAHLLNLTQHVGHHSQTVRDGRWNAQKDFCYWDYPMMELAGLTMGIVGFGQIGQAVGKLAIAFGLRVVACDVVVSSHVLERIEMVDLDHVFCESDVVSLHCPLTPETQNLVNKNRLMLMKRSAFLINTSRGKLIDERALADALNNGRIAGAGLDVLAVEPPQENTPLLKAKNCYITPHIAWATRSARARLMAIAVGNVKAFLNKKPQNIVNSLQ